MAVFVLPFGTLPTPFKFYYPNDTFGLSVIALTSPLVNDRTMLFRERKKAFAVSHKRLVENSNAV
jgi:hypothetical protein